MKRIFAAIKINPSEKLIELFNNLKSDLREEKIKWVYPEKMHLTLKFFGETPENKIEEIIELLDDAIFEIDPFDIHLEDIGIFGSTYKPRVIWIGFRDYKPLKRLFEAIKARLERAGYEYDRQNFVPHLTLGRIKFIRNKRYFQSIIEKYKNIEIQSEQIDKLILFESILKPQGPEYIVIEEFRF